VIGTAVITTMQAVAIMDIATAMIVTGVTTSHQETMDTISPIVMMTGAEAIGVAIGHNLHSQTVMITRAEAIGVAIGHNLHSQVVMITRAEAIGVAIGRNLHSQAKTVDKTRMVMAGIEVRHNRQIITGEAVTGVTMVAAVKSPKLKTQDKAALPVQDYK
jgi:hypothetical protein